MKQASRVASTTDSPGRILMRALRRGIYEPTELAAQLFAQLERMERESDRMPAYDRYRSRTGLVCAPEFRGVRGTGRVEDSITAWLAEGLPNGRAQVGKFAPRARPDIVVAYERDSGGDDVCVIVEAKPVWQRWITGVRRTSGPARSDALGHTTGPYLSRNIPQVVETREKLRRVYTDPRDRHVVLALVFQRAGEVDQRLSSAMGGAWDHRARHIRDLCAPPNDTLGLTAMVFWPRTPAQVSSS